MQQEPDHRVPAAVGHLGSDEATRAPRLGVRRLAAWLIDWLCILVWVAFTAAIGVPLYLEGVIPPTGYLASNVIAALVVVVPVVAGAAWFESRAVPATPGKRALGLRVTALEGSPRFRAALLRNAVKIGIPWVIGHAAVYAIVAGSGAAGSAPAWVWVLTGAAYVLPLVWVVSLFVAGGRTPYDRISGTTVVSGDAPPPPRRA